MQKAPLKGNQNVRLRGTDVAIHTYDSNVIFQAYIEPFPEV